MTDTMNADDAYAQAVEMLGGGLVGENAVHDVLQGIINGEYVPHPLGMTQLFNIMLTDATFMEGFND